jgi:acyl-CoA thioester hydrolase
MPREPSSAFSHRLRVYWEDTDAGGIVFYANYLKFFERARTEWLRAKGVSQEALRLETGLMFVVADTSVRFHAPARLDDLLDVSVLPVEIARAYAVVEQQAWRGDVLLAEGRIRIGCIEAGTFKPRRIPQHIFQPPSATQQ